MNNHAILIRNGSWTWLRHVTSFMRVEQWVVLLSVLLAAVSTFYSYQHGYTLSYGDAESHLNIAKRVVDSLTPGFAQLGGIWLPLPHILLIPFVYSDFLWRTGLAGSIISGLAFIVSSLYLYKLGHLLTRHKGAAFLGALVFMSNPNILYLQSTPMTEVVLIAFFVLSSYFFIRFLRDDTKLLMLVAAAGFAFCASLSRYDGWALALMEAGVLVLYYLPFKLNLTWFRTLDEDVALIIANGKRSLLARWHTLEGRVLLFAALGFFGIALWLLWGWLILGDPLYFTHSQFSASSQQNSWLARGELPAYHHPLIALLYYATTSMETVGTLMAVAAIVGVCMFLATKAARHRGFILLVLAVPFFFNVLTLFLGQSVIFLPGVTPLTFDWTLFNVRYGAMMVPIIALFVGYAFGASRVLGRAVIITLLALQGSLFLIGFTPVLSFEDGVAGLSSATAKTPDAQEWLAKHYDYGILLTDDFARTISIVRSPIAMKDIIYIGNKPYWEESLIEPQKYARWIVMQKNDAVWTAILDNPLINGRLYKYFNKAYTSEEILIFQRNEVE